MKKVTYTALASSLKVVRLICKRDNCGAVAEVPVGKLFKADAGGYQPADIRCPGCNKSHRYETEMDKDHLRLLGLALHTAAAHAAESDVEFVIHAEAD